jgi:hypothetical protein
MYQKMHFKSFRAQCEITRCDDVTRLLIEKNKHQMTTCQYCDKTTIGRSTICTSVLCRRQRNVHNKRNSRSNKRKVAEIQVRKKQEEQHSEEQLSEDETFSILQEWAFINRDYPWKKMPDDTSLQQLAEMIRVHYVEHPLVQPLVYPARPHINDCDKVFLGWPMEWSEETLITNTHETMVKVYEKELLRQKIELIEGQRILLIDKTMDELKQLKATLINRVSKRKERGKYLPHPFDDVKLCAVKRSIRMFNNNHYGYRRLIPLSPSVKQVAEDQ